MTDFPLINAVLAGVQDGKIFGRNSGDFYFVKHKAGFCYATKTGNTGYQFLLSRLIVSPDIPQYFHVYDAGKELIAACGLIQENVNTRIRSRKQLQYKKTELQGQSDIPTGYSVSKIDYENFDACTGFHLDLESKFWRSREDFLENGFGFVINNAQGLPVSICYTACVADEVAEIDVATLPEYQKKGLAKIAVTAFVSHCIDKNIIANWDCFCDNIASLKTAEHIGFSVVKEYTFLSIFLKSRQHEGN